MTAEAISRSAPRFRGRFQAAANRKAWEIPREALVHKVSQGLRAFPQVVLNSPSTALSLLPPPPPPVPAMAFKRKLDFDDETAAATVRAPGAAMSRAYTHAPQAPKQLKLVPFPSYAADTDVAMSDASSEDAAPWSRPASLSSASAVSFASSAPASPGTRIHPSQSAPLTGRMQSRSALSSPATACSRRRRPSPLASSAAACSARASSTIGARPAPPSAPR
jgi:hypothetical protein